jgi:hypothetical protein
MNAGFEVGLIGGGNFGGRNIVPLELVAHAPARDDGHLQIGASKAAMFHRGKDK